MLSEQEVKIICILLICMYFILEQLTIGKSQI
jgi:hypothetical protein